MQPSLKYIRVGVSQLILDPANVRKHSEKNIESIKGSLAKFGQQKPIVIGSDLTVVAGNGTVLAARALEWHDLDAVQTDLTGAELVAYAITDNRTAELAEWDLDPLGQQLTGLLDDGWDLEPLGWDSADLDALLDTEPPDHSHDEAKVDQAAELMKKWETAPGQLWVIGAHRLLCGSAIIEADVERLLDGAKPHLTVTDPPYGVNYDPEWRDVLHEGDAPTDSKARNRKVQNDDTADWTPAFQLSPSNVIYCWHAGRYASTVQASLEASGFEIRSQIIWSKPHFPISRGHYHWRHEPCWYAVRKGSTADWTGDRKQNTIWEVALDVAVEGGHSTQKPVECMGKPLRNHGGDVYDPFVGSGTTLVAAQDSNRCGFAMEIDPGYVAVVLERMADLGLVPELMEE
jgi:DNA modification methylase